MLNMHTQNIKKLYIFGVFKAKYSERSISVFYLLGIFGISTHCRTINDMFGIVRKFWVENLHLFKNIDLKIWPFWPDLDPTSVKSRFWWHHMVKWPSLSISTCKKDPENMCCMACLWLLFYSELLGPDLDIDLFLF